MDGSGKALYGARNGLAGMALQDASRVDVGRQFVWVDGCTETVPHILEMSSLSEHGPSPVPEPGAGPSPGPGSGSGSGSDSGPGPGPGPDPGPGSASAYVVTGQEYH